MTREEIKVMPAGRELDALVAEKVMGFVWKCYERPRSWRIQEAHEEEGLEYTDWYWARFLTASWLSADPAWRDARPDDTLDDDWDRDVLEYSTNIAHAFHVVNNRCTGEGRHADFHLHFDAGMPPERKGEWWAHFCGPTDASGDTPALAICRAALLAVLEDSQA